MSHRQTKGCLAPYSVIACGVGRRPKQCPGRLVAALTGRKNRHHIPVSTSLSIPMAPTLYDGRYVECAVPCHVRRAFVPNVVFPFQASLENLSLLRHSRHSING